MNRYSSTGMESVPIACVANVYHWLIARKLKQASRMEATTKTQKNLWTKNQNIACRIFCLLEFTKSKGNSCDDKARRTINRMDTKNKAEEHEFPLGHSDPTQCEVQGRQVTGHVLSLCVLFVADSQTKPLMTIIRSFASFTLHARAVNSLRWQGDQAPTYATFSTVRWF